MAKLPPRVVSGKSKKQPEKPARRSADPDAPAAAGQTQSSRSFGLGLMGMGVFAMIMPLFGLQLRQLGDNGQFTPVVGVILFLIGGVTFAVSFSKTSANFATLAAKGVLWAVIGGFALIFILGAVALVIMSIH
jgi:hypothetical protein